MSRDLAIDIHKMTLKNLPRFEIYEEGSQIRRSMKFAKSNIVEGYGRRIYKQEYIRFLIYSQASCDGTLDHFDNLHIIESLKDKHLYEDLNSRLEILGKKLNTFLKELKKNIIRT